MPVVKQVFSVQMDEEDYRLVGPGGEEGPMVPYGNMATLVIEDEIYYCQVDDRDDEPEVFRVESVNPVDAKTEEVEFPASVVKAQRALDAAIEGTTGAGIALVDTDDAETDAEPIIE